MKNQTFNENRLGWSLWRRYLLIAQEFWLPKDKEEKIGIYSFILFAVSFLLSSTYFILIIINKIFKIYSEGKVFDLLNKSYSLSIIAICFVSFVALFNFKDFWFKNKKESVKPFVGLLILVMLTGGALLMALTKITVLIMHKYNASIMDFYAKGLNEWTTAMWSKFGLVFTFTLISLTLIIFQLRNRIRNSKAAWGFLVMLLFLSMTISGINVVISYTGRFLWNTVYAKSADDFWKFIYFNAVIYITCTPIVVIYPWFRKLLAVKWREFMADGFIVKYLHNRAYYELTSNKIIDNPDQRIAQDINNYTSVSLSFLLIILGSIIDIIAFSGVLWSISKDLTYILIIYATVGTIGTVLLGKRLVGINYRQLKKEADFRYGLIHVRDSAESIAFYKGEDREKNQLFLRFSKVISNYKHLIGWQRNLGFFTTYYTYFIALVPISIVAPMFFKGKIEFGMMTQALGAFSQVLGAVSFIVDQFEGIAGFAAGINRIDTFDKALDEASGFKIETDKKTDLGIDRISGDKISTENLSLSTPNLAQKLFNNLNINIEKGRSLLVIGPSGVGKSSLLRAIAGLWNSGTGKVTFPEKDVFFIPQKPYMILGTLREQLLYPGFNTDVTDKELEEVLNEVNLPHLTEKLKNVYPDLDSVFDALENWEDMLSQGEQQRLAFARLMVNKPQYAILDESTSALDVGNEEKIYERLKAAGITLLSVGHRESIRKYHTEILELNTDGSWNLIKNQ
ncbi:MAG: ATP-binding cassette domain-containing protein [Spirochaetes bacterium]|nr:ATP-binding cassette domain-containing protein [Spirochaetota bacterium]